MVVAIVVAVTRLYLRVHYLSDVVGGLCVGAALYALCASVGVVISYVRNNGFPRDVPAST